MLYLEDTVRKKKFSLLNYWTHRSYDDEKNDDIRKFAKLLLDHVKKIQGEEGIMN